MPAREKDDLAQCYRVLEVSPSASAEDLRSAYRLLVNVWHPDRFAHDPALQARVAEKLKAVNKAYEQLKQVSPSRGEAPAPSPPAASPPRRAATTDGSLLRLRVAVVEPDAAAVEWEKLAPHPILFGERPRIALAALAYGRALAGGAGVRPEVILHVENGIERLRRGGRGLLPAEEATTIGGAGGFHAWPRRMVRFPAGRLPLLEVLLEGVTVSRLKLAAWAREETEAVGLALIGLCALEARLADVDRRVLVGVLAGLNEYYASPSESFEPGSESLALARVAARLDGAPIP